jgi:hypothetical protein
MNEHNTTITVTTKNTPALTLGIIAIVLGVLAMLVGWIPFLGLLALPIAGIGIFMAFIGLILSLIKKFKGIGMPLLGVVICFFAIVISIGSTGSTSVAIVEAIEETNASLNDAIELETKEGREYIDSYLELYDIKASYRDSFLDGRVPGVLFKIRNTGTRTLNQVNVVVYFKDASGNVIAEEDYIPVLVSEYSFNDDNPLKPGYIWSMEQNKFYTAKSVPSEWKEGSVDIKISKIEFAPEE